MYVRWIRFIQYRHSIYPVAVQQFKLVIKDIKLAILSITSTTIHMVTMVTDVRHPSLAVKLPQTLDGLALDRRDDEMN